VAVVGYAVGLIGLIGVKILAPGFYAQKDIRTPVKIAVFVLIATQLANLVLVPWLAHAGLALSVSLGACVNALALFIGLKRRGLYRAQARWGGFMLRLLVALGTLALVLWLLQRPLDWTAMQSTPWQRTGWLALVIGAGGAAYFVVLAVLGFRPRDFRHHA
jgi:putative peptidoglycan lipid II flippase